MADQMRDPLLFGFEPEEISGSFTAVLPFCVLFAIVFAASSHAWSRFSLSTQDRFVFAFFSSYSLSSEHACDPGLLITGACCLPLSLV